MDVVDKVIGENEILYIDKLSPHIWIHFENVMSLNFAKLLYFYISRKDSNQEVVKALKDHLYDCMKPYIIDLILDKCGVTDTIRGVSPRDITYSSDLDKIITNIERIKEEYGTFQVNLHQPTADDFNQFVAAFCAHVKRMAIEGIPVTYVNVADRFKANRNLFYSRTEQEQSDVKMLIRRQYAWETMYQGALYMKYCLSNNISQQYWELF